LTWINALMIVPGWPPLSPAMLVMCLDASSESLSMSLSWPLALPIAASLVSVLRAGLSPLLMISAASLSIRDRISGLARARCTFERGIPVAASMSRIDPPWMARGRTRLCCSGVIPSPVFWGSRGRGCLCFASGLIAGRCFIIGCHACSLSFGFLCAPWQSPGAWSGSRRDRSLSVLTLCITYSGRRTIFRGHC